MFVFAPDDAYAEDVRSVGAHTVRLPRMASKWAIIVNLFPIIISLLFYLRVKKISLVLSYTILPNLLLPPLCTILKVGCFLNIAGLGGYIVGQSGPEQRFLLSIYKFSARLANVVFFQNSDDMSDLGFVNNARGIRLPGSGVVLAKYPLSVLEQQVYEK